MYKRPGRAAPCTTCPPREGVVSSTDIARPHHASSNQPPTVTIPGFLENSVSINTKRRDRWFPFTFRVRARPRIGQAFVRCTRTCHTESERNQGHVPSWQQLQNDEVWSARPRSATVGQVASSLNAARTSAPALPVLLGAPEWTWGSFAHPLTTACRASRRGNLLSCAFLSFTFHPRAPWLRLVPAAFRGASLPPRCCALWLPSSSS